MGNPNKMYLSHNLMIADQQPVSGPHDEFSHPWFAFVHVAQHVITRKSKISKQFHKGIFIVDIETQTAAGILRVSLTCHHHEIDSMFRALVTNYMQVVEATYPPTEEIIYSEEVVKSIILMQHEKFLHDLGLDKTSTLKDILNIVS